MASPEIANRIKRAARLATDTVGLTVGTLLTAVNFKFYLETGMAVVNDDAAAKAKIIGNLIKNYPYPASFLDYFNFIWLEDGLFRFQQFINLVPNENTRIAAMTIALVGGPILLALTAKHFINGTVQTRQSPK